MIRPILKELTLEPCTENLTEAAEFLDNLDFTKVKTKYTKGSDWTAISLYGYGPKITDILKPGVLKSSVKIDEKLQWTNLHEATPLNPVFKILENLPCKYERVRFMKLEAGKIIGRHSDKIDKDLGFDDGQIMRIHIPIRTNDDVVFSLYESPRAKVAYEYNLKTGHYYYMDVTKPHAVRNMSEVDRIHLVVDCYVNDSLRTMVA
ncbi:MAG: aspartyl/asparaginyl beta-hydroxylase domain-containing protein [Pelagibacteraceae bacterium]|nr:aspartyl/asparaginyl beta-hydroxylase domain-containing protein [Pelagibacteraceae bacterium]